MHLSSSIRLGGLFLLLVTVASGCRCGTDSVAENYGDLGIAHRDEKGTAVISRDALFDFGTLPMGEKVTLKLLIRNLGTSSLTLATMEHKEGSPVTIGDVVMDQSAFDVRFTPGAVVEAGSSVEMEMSFTPPHQASNGDVAHEAKLVLTGGNTRPGQETALITLRGKATAGACSIPEVIDFGKVALGAHGARTVTFTNPGSHPAEAFVGQAQSGNGDHQSFTLGAGTPNGSFSLQPGATQTVTVEFRPTETRAYEATIELRASSQCGGGQVTLLGEGVDEVLEWHPTSLDFGFVAPGTEAPKFVTFINHGGSDVELFDISSTRPSDFGAPPLDGDAPGRFVVPANSQRDMKVICKPSQLGPRTGQLNFKTPITKQPGGVIDLTCFGGGPDIRTMPSGAVGFGKTAFFPATTPPYSVMRKITVMNVGALPPNGDPDGNLRLGKKDGNGKPGIPPFMALVPLNQNTQASEFSIGLPPNYDPAVGLRAQVGQNAMDITLTFTPASLGAKQAELTIFSNDPDTPETKLLITADVVEVPPCNYMVSPEQVSFGLVTPGTSKEVPVTFTNLGTQPGETCLISGVDLAPGTDPAYTMPNGAVASRELAPGESFQALVKVAPQGQVPGSVVNLTGTLRYYASSPAKPSGTVPLSTSVGPSCLTIAPAHADFGAVKPGCNSATRTFTVYNVCTQAMTVTGITMQVAAGQNPGGPNCPGSQACPEFFITQVPAIGSGLNLAPGSNVTFQARYRPIDIGKDTGVISVNVTQNGLPVNYLVTLEGEGEATGTNTDIFVQDHQPKADVLFTIDNSCSMDVYQNSLANNFSSFIQYAVAAGVDWQIGVTTTDMDDGFPSPFPGIPAVPPGDKGKLRGDANNPKILTPSTPNVQALFQNKVKVGTDGSGTERGLEPSLKALTPPLSVAENAGFLRDEANLAVVVVTDVRDQSPQSATFYLNSFLNIKGFNRANMFSFNAIGPFAQTPPAGCAGYDSEGPDDGSYAYVVAQTNGIKDEICTTNWANTLQNLGQTAFGFRTTFFLTATPDLGQTVTVLINGVPVPAQSGGQTNWTYDSVSNAIVFDSTVTPGPGETLTVSYTVGCL